MSNNSFLQYSTVINIIDTKFEGNYVKRTKKMEKNSLVEIFCSHLKSCAKYFRFKLTTNQKQGLFMMKNEKKSEYFYKKERNKIACPQKFVQVCRKQCVWAYL